MTVTERYVGGMGGKRMDPATLPIKGGWWVKTVVNTLRVFGREPRFVQCNSRVCKASLRDVTHSLF